MRSFSHTRGGRQRFLPHLEVLEDRCVPSTLQDGSVRGIHGGTAVQNGTSLTVTVNSTNNSVQVQDDGIGDITVKWNGGASHLFHGINNLTINTGSQTQSNTVTYAFTNVLLQGETINVNLRGTSSNNCTVGMEGMTIPSGGLVQEALIRVTDTGKASDSIHLNDVGAVTGFAALVFDALGGGGNDNLSAAQTGDITGGATVGFDLRAALSAGKANDTFFTSLQGNVGARGDQFGSTFASNVVGRFGNGSINNITSDYLTGTVGPTGNVQMSELGPGSQNTFVMLVGQQSQGSTSFQVQGNAPNGLNHAEVTPNVGVFGVQSTVVV
jgi:hypothetical protein